MGSFLKEIQSTMSKVNKEIDRYQSLPSDTSDMFTIQDIRKNLFHLSHAIDRYYAKVNIKVRKLKFDRNVQEMKLKEQYQGKISYRPDFLKEKLMDIDKEIMEAENIRDIIEVYQKTIKSESISCTTHIKLLVDEQYKSRSSSEF